MRFLRKRASPTPSPELPPAEGVHACLHVALAPQWDDLAGMGVEAKASHWLCGACGELFTPEQAQELRSNEAERLKQALGGD
ncbi:MAG: hypothetical protein C0506_02060 [Anaerolinea sp.]|nr:hypothetical protein [Anaerolinea sp.]